MKTHEAYAAVAKDHALLQRRIAELEAEARSLRQTILTISEDGNALAQSIVEAYARKGDDLFAERRR